MKTNMLNCSILVSLQALLFYFSLIFFFFKIGKHSVKLLDVYFPQIKQKKKQLKKEGKPPEIPEDQPDKV